MSERLMNKESYFIVLDDLRESGKINMFGAPRYLMDSFGVPKEEAHAIFLEWTEQFGGPNSVK